MTASRACGENDKTIADSTMRRQLCSLFARELVMGKG